MSRAQLIALIRECRSHVYRQQHAGAHEQDRQDAKALLIKIVEVLNIEEGLLPRASMLDAVAKWRNQ